MSAQIEIKTIEEFESAPQEFKDAVRKIVRSHSVNELQGARAFDEPAIALAPTPYAKWLTCRVAMEEYAHHVRFRELGDKIGIPEAQLEPGRDKAHNTIFEFELTSWAEFCVIKMFADLAEILQVEDLLHCPFHPLRNLARSTMPEERFHHDFGVEFVGELIKTEEGRKAVQEAMNRYIPLLPPFFGAPNSKNNDMYRKWGIKQRKNEEMVEDFLVRAKEAADKYGLVMPEVKLAA
ncbi:MAG: phenylacetate-CoA oxygenase subunit PaaI [Gammaproteobacteria bacterium]|nr:phenylacetate-CoA oxygenase subunit PaaI [Gammaproteobacteria bacterium]